MTVEAFPSSVYYPEVTPGLPIVSTRDLIERGQKAAAIRRMIAPVIEAEASDETVRQNVALISGLGGRAIAAAEASTAGFGNGIGAAVFTLFNDGQEAVESAPVRPIPVRTAQRAGEFAIAA